MHGSHALVSPPPMSSRHRILEAYSRWHMTICKLLGTLGSYLDLLFVVHAVN